MKTIAKNDFYSIFYDTVKNRFYLTIVGYWQDPSEVPHYLSDWQKGISQSEKGFTILADIRQMRTHPREVVLDLHVTAQKMLIEAGLLCTADVIPENLMAEGQVDAIAHKSRMPKAEFQTIEQAELWLDKQASI